MFIDIRRARPAVQRAGYAIALAAIFTLATIGCVIAKIATLCGWKPSATMAD